MFVILYAVISTIVFAMLFAILINVFFQYFIATTIRILFLDVGQVIDQQAPRRSHGMLYFEPLWLL